MDAAVAITQFAKMLNNLDRWLDAGSTFAGTKNFPVDVLATSRLAPDQYELIRQIQSACDAAKYAAAYLSGDTAPSHADVEQTVEQLKARVRTCVTYLESIAANKFEGAATRRVSPPWLGGQWIAGDRYLTEVAIPNFYFHVTMAYAILRHNGVPLGKLDYIGSLPVNDA